MEQIDYATLGLLQATGTTRQSTSESGKSGKDTGFQDLLEKKCQTAGEQGTAAKTDGKAEAPSSKPVADGEDPVVRELACGQVLVVNILPMMTEEVQMPTEQTIVPETALTAVTLPETPAVQAPAAAEVRPTVQTEQTAELPETVETAAPTAETVAPVTDSTASSQTEERQDLPTDKREDDRTEVVDAEAAPQPLFREVEPHMVKVGETAGTKETEQTADVNRQITDQLTEALETGESKVEIRLTPETLGTVTVEVTQQKDGGLHVSLTAENSHTRALLQQHTASLQELLGSQNQKTVQVEVNRQETRQDFLQDHGQNSQGQGGQQQEQHQRQPQNSQDFLQQLRLGLIPLDVETV